MNGLFVNHGMISTKLDFTVTKPVKITRDSNIRYSAFECLYEGVVCTARELILIILNQELCIRSYLTLGRKSVLFEGTGNQVGRDGLVRP